MDLQSTSYSNILHLVPQQIGIKPYFLSSNDTNVVDEWYEDLQVRKIDKIKNI